MYEEPQFMLGNTTITPTAMTRLERLKLSPMDFIIQHVYGDYGDITDQERQSNENTIEQGCGRVLSTYQLTSDDIDQKLWIVTEIHNIHETINITKVSLPEDH